MSIHNRKHEKTVNAKDVSLLDTGRGLPVTLHQNIHPHIWGAVLERRPSASHTVKKTTTSRTSECKETFFFYDSKTPRSWTRTRMTSGCCHDDRPVPGSGENSVDDWILGILGAHQEHVLCGDTRRGQVKGDARHRFSVSGQKADSRSSSKCVSMPLTPGTEHKSRAFRNVVHLFTRLLWPPMSFCTHQMHLEKQKLSRRLSWDALEPGFSLRVLVCVCVCVVTLHSCPILEMVALPVCSPSMAFSLKNRKILSSSGLSLSGIKCTPTNLGSGGKRTHPPRDTQTLTRKH